MDNLRGAEEGELLEMAVGGDDGAVNVLLTRYRDKAFGTALGMTENADDADDLVQDAFTAAWLGISMLEKSDAFWTWLRTIIRNTWKDTVKNVEAGPWINRYFDDRDPDQKPTIHSLDAMIEDGWDMADESSDPAVIYEEQESLEMGLSALDDLPPRQRECAELALAGYDYREIADILDISYDNVRANISLARRKLEAA